ncbi:MAG: aminotransferase class IV [Deltaproteobacteria bacterium]|nr:aminotransferase class IV [Deltaproteobacteria bacterium]
MLYHININGKLTSVKNARISIFDHGFLYGDSVYETLVTYDGRPFYLKEHLKRLERSAKAIHIKPTWSSEKYEKEILKTLKKFQKLKKEAIVRIMLTRGEGDIGLDPDLCKKPNNIILAWEFKGYPQKYYKKGINLHIVSVRRNAPNALNPAIKSCNFLNNILAFIEAKNKGAFDGVMLNQKGYVTEGTTSNIFIVKNNVLLTPKLETGILSGITRKLVFELCRKNNINAKEANITAQDVLRADECFITSTTKEVMPVSSCNGKKINQGGVRPLTKTLIHLYREHVNKVLGH